VTDCLNGDSFLYFLIQFQRMIAVPAEILEG